MRAALAALRRPSHMPAMRAALRAALQRRPERRQLWSGALTMFYTGTRPVMVFTAGAPGAGKTYTMQGLTDALVADLHEQAEAKFGENQITFMVSFFEIYGGRCQDLLNDRYRLQVCVCMCVCVCVCVCVSTWSMIATAFR